MVYKLNGEQPFQVLSSDFSISPSESGYELYFSADGFNYTSFATVGAGVTRQFTGMNAGNYYKLMGNTGEVSVNWERDCCGGQGGGGTAGVSSLNGQTGALTTKTINGNDILGSGDITIEGGSGAKTYVLNLMSNDERIALLNEISSTYPSGSYDTISSGFPVSDYQFYYYIEGYGDDGNGFIPLRITTVSPQIVVRFEGILNGYVARTFKELTLECLFDGKITVRKNAIYDLPTASSSTLGGVKIGNGLSIDADGVLSAKVVSLSQSDYDALVQAGTVDANTLYVII